ncbi:MAG: hemolysin family protein [Anaerolineales bacterium]
MDVSLEILIILFLILVNGAFALSEMAVVSSRKARLQQRVNEGSLGSKTALYLAENPSKFLSTVQIGITLIGVLAGAFGGARIAKPLAAQFEQVPALAPYSLSLALGVVVASITFLSLVLGELVPKRLALHNPERAATVIAGPMMFVSRLFSPLVWLLGAVTDLTLRLLGVKPGLEPPVTEEELLVQLDQGTQAGIFGEAEQDMVEGVFRLHDRRVFSLMTPRSEIVWLNVNDSPEEIRKVIEESPFSQFPVCEDSLDKVLGIIKARDLLIESLRGETLRLQLNLQPVMYIPETAHASRALEIFKAGQSEMLMVVDEFGSVEGLLTISDILEEIVGDIQDGEPQATQRQDGSWLLDGMLDVEDFKEIFNIRHLPDEEEYETLGGFIMNYLGSVPHESDMFEWNGLRFEVMDMDGNRVDKVMVTLKPVKNDASI